MIDRFGRDGFIDANQLMPRHERMKRSLGIHIDTLTMGSVRVQLLHAGRLCYKVPVFVVMWGTRGLMK